jgi:hypothetical protein
MCMYVRLVVTFDAGLVWNSISQDDTRIGKHLDWNALNRVKTNKGNNPLVVLLKRRNAWFIGCGVQRENCWRWNLENLHSFGT